MNESVIDCSLFDDLFIGELDKKKTHHPSVIDIFTKEHVADSSEHGDAIQPPSFDVTVTIPEETLKEDAEAEDDVKGKQK